MQTHKKKNDNKIWTGRKIEFWWNINLLHLNICYMCLLALEVERHLDLDKRLRALSCVCLAFSRLIASVTSFRAWFSVRHDFVQTASTSSFCTSFSLFCCLCPFLPLKKKPLLFHSVSSFVCTVEWIKKLFCGFFWRSFYSTLPSALLLHITLTVCASLKSTPPPRTTS